MSYVTPIITPDTDPIIPSIASSVAPTLPFVRDKPASKPPSPIFHFYS